ncbi:hypothetical protein SGLAU_32990 (plasmid) [Streptomyces glaucescens]|uniref:Uncharacterized protein n=1 Tax=Streptomyces glaucescens TaxID=1907 RepID=A0A089XEX2_STRGA|nr:hypothetical protein SGLAU_32990 [Streptomyces glaucescens]
MTPGTDGSDAAPAQRASVPLHQGRTQPELRKGTLTYPGRRAARYSPIIQSMPHSSQPNRHMPASARKRAPP